MENYFNSTLLLRHFMEFDDVQTLAELIQRTAFKVNQPINVKRQTILQYSIIANNFDCFDYLLTVPGLQLDCQDVDGVTPLIQATLRDNPHYVKGLLEKGADSSLCDYSGDTPLHLADSEEVCQLLIDHGCDMNAVNDCGMSALHKIVDKDLDHELCYMLLDHGIDAKIMDDFGNTALSLAICHDSKVDLKEILALYTYDHIKEPIPLLDFIHLMITKDLRFIFDQVLDSCSAVFSTNWGMKQFVIKFLHCDAEMLSEFFKRKPTVLIEIFKYCVSHFRYSVPFDGQIISGRDSLACLEFLENNSLFDYYETLESNMHLHIHYGSHLLESLSSLIYIFLSRGFIVTFDLASTVYTVYGDCNLFRELLYFDSDFSFKTTFLNLWQSSFASASPIGLLILQPRLTMTQYFLNLLYDIKNKTRIVPLFDYFASRALQDFCWIYSQDDEKVRARLLQMPTVPKLLELARDVTRQHIIKTLNCTKASTFYFYIKHLPIADDYKDILTYKTKIY